MYFAFMVQIQGDLYLSLERATSEMERRVLIAYFLRDFDLREVSAEKISLSSKQSVSVDYRKVPFAVGHKYKEIQWNGPSVPRSYSEEEYYLLALANDARLLLLGRDSVFVDRREDYIHPTET